MRRFRLWYLAVFVAMLLGIAVGVSAFTFTYAKGFSYMSNDPRACVNCHIMNDQYNGWQRSPHHAVATCNDCHVPHDLVGKYFTKALNGYHHSSAFTLQNFHEPIMIGPRNARILQENCIRCHADFVSNIVHSKPDVANGAIQCTQCHRQVGHDR